MKSPSLFLKIFVLAGFVSSIAALVAYRTGHLDGLLYGQTYTSNTVSMEGTQAFPVDSPPPKKDDVYMSTSKSFIVDDGRTSPPDTVKVDSTVKYLDVMGSSKSARIIEPVKDTGKHKSSQKPK